MGWSYTVSRGSVSEEFFLQPATEPSVGSRGDGAIKECVEYIAPRAPLTTILIGLMLMVSAGVLIVTNILSGPRLSKNPYVEPTAGGVIALLGLFLAYVGGRACLRARRIRSEAIVRWSDFFDYYVSVSLTTSIKPPN